ncbi:unnamed protein product [Mytilus coruscus]|uniref:Uncharacterized protein n=1 Tax=Mytilus coruscus TaxID=42192 RepID=A0A6J8ETH5_MYTCO|nr:unnamed protein product [Mytilus coruscus]
MASKSFRIASTTSASETHSAPQKSKPYDWNLCLICQNSTEEQLQCPADSKRSNVGAGYISLSENLVRFNEIGCLPDSINLTILDDGSSIANTLVKNNAKFHKSCSLKFNSTKLKRAQKRQLLSDDVVEDSGQKKAHTRASLSCDVSLKEYVCFLCGSSSSDDTLHHVSTYNVDSRVRECAVKLQDTAILTKLAAVMG